MTQNGDVRFDYRLQVWVSSEDMEDLVLPCGHPESMGAECCNGRRFAGMTLDEAWAVVDAEGGQQ